MQSLLQHEEKLECSTVVLGGSSEALKEALKLAKDRKVCMVTPTSTLVNESPILTDDFSSYSEYYDNLTKLISEVRNNENITILRNASVEKHEPLTLATHAVYVDEEKCDGCGDCIKACPVNILDFNEGGMVDTTPIAGNPGEGEEAKVAITRLSQPYCQASCPIAMDARGYIGNIADGDVEAANEVIARTNPLPEICGKICTHVCESTCAREAMDEPVQVRNIKRFAAERNTQSFELAEKRNTDEANKVAIIGSGPAGLAAAADLAVRGYPVTIFEALPEAGGMLKVGIPDFRLSDDTLQKELENIMALGVEIKTNSPIGKELAVKQILSEHGYKAVFICVGAHKSTKLRIEGEDLPGVHAGVTFLRELNLGKSPEVGNKVVVIGGGNVAIDTARAARRLGTEEVTILYRRTHTEMPAYSEEVEQAIDEGITIEFLSAPTMIKSAEVPEGRSAENCASGSGGQLAVECIRMELGEPDESGRRRPVPVEGSEYTVEADTVISAIGQSVRPDFLEGIGDLKLNPNGTIAVDENCATSMERVYAGGDGSRGPASVIEAIADGKNAAKSIDQALSGTGPRATGSGSLSEGYYIDGETKPSELTLLKLQKHQNQFLFKNQKSRHGENLLDSSNRITNFDEVELGLSVEEAEAEAERCLGCRLCIGCGICAAVCPKQAVDFSILNRGIEVDAERSFDYRVPREKYILPSMVELYKESYNVITSTELEAMLKSDGAYGGLIMRPYDGEIPKSIGFVDIGKEGERKRGKDSGSGPRAPGTGHRAPGTGPRAPGTGPRAPGTGHRVPSHGHRVPSHGHRVPSPEPRATSPEQLGSLHIARLANYVKKNYPDCAVKLFTDNKGAEESKELGEDAVQVPDMAIEEDPRAHTFTITYSSEDAEESLQTDLIVVASILEN